MIDVFSDGMRLVHAHSAAAVPALALAGLLAGIGPCAAPRYVAVMALTRGSQRPWLTTALFAAGVIAAYIGLGLCAGLLGASRHWSTAIDLGLAAALAIGGLVTLLHDDGHRADHYRHDAQRAALAPAHAGAVTCMGAASALVLSPCCTPVVAAIASAAALGAEPAQGALLLAAFACGHLLPMAIATTCGRAPAKFFARIGFAHGNAVISGTLMLALAGYYGILA